MTKQTPPTV